MRLLHTSDWHLGRTFHRRDLAAAQARVVDHLVAVVRAERVDAVLVAGDVYDRALPGVDTVALLDEALDRLLDAGAAVVLTSGNHDSATRLGFGARRAAKAGLHVRTDPARVAEPVLLADRHGDFAIYPLPYLEPALVADRLGAERSHAGVLAAATAAARADLAARGGPRTAVLAHAFVTGGMGCDSERELTVGGAGHVPLDAFGGLGYVALGHLHGRQQLAPQARYSGSPLAYSFSEAGHTKGYWLVDVDGTGRTTVEPVDAPVPYRLARLRGGLDELLTAPALAVAEEAWCQVTLTDAHRPEAPMERLRHRFPHTLELLLEPDGGPAERGGYADRVAGRTDLEVCCGFLEHVRGRPASEQERALLVQSLEELMLAELEPASSAVADPSIVPAAAPKHSAAGREVAG